ncbi:MAG: hypothetical protein ACRCT3_08980 [Aeromonas hydrophila]
MGMKQIWDGEQLPPIGCEVLIHLASYDKWIKHEVTGHNICPDIDGDKYKHAIFVQVKRGNATNERLLADVRPVDFTEE